MPVLPDFQPENASYGRTANSLISGFEEGQSMMARAQAMRLREEQSQRAKFEFEAKKPVIVANAMADVASAQASIANATQLEILRGRAAKESSAYNAEFLQALQYDSRNDVEASDGTPEGDAAQNEQAEYATQETLNTRSAKLAELQAKIGWMELIPAYKGFVDTVGKKAAEAHLAAASNLRLTEMMTAANLRAKAAADATAAGIEKEQIKANARTSAATGHDQSRERIAAIQSDTKLTLQERGARIAEEKQGATLADLQTRAAAADQLAADASASGDEQAAAAHRAAASSYRDAVQKNSTFAGQAPQPVPSKSPNPRPHPKPAASQPSPEISVSIPGSEVDGADKGAVEPVTPTSVAPTKVDPKATTVEIGGKTYPIYKDKNGKRAYKVDGHYVPID